MTKNIIILVLIVGICLFVHYTESPYMSSHVVYKEVRDTKTQDSLQKIIEEQTYKIDSLKKNVKFIKEVVVKERVKDVQKLPLDSALSYFKSGLVKDGTYTTLSDSFPLPLIQESGDTIISMSKYNLKDANEILVKLEAEREVVKNLEEVVVMDSVVMTNQENQIKSLNRSIDGLQEGLKFKDYKIKSEKKKKNILWISLGILTGILIFK